MSEVDTHVEWLPSPSDDDGVRIGKTPAGVIVDWRGIGTLRATAHSSEFRPVEGVDGAKLEKFRATALLGCRRYLTGRLSLHASAVALGSRALVIVGESGAGKSTTAMALVENAGGAFLADDIVPIDWTSAGPAVPPVEDSFWLTGDSSAWFGLGAASEEKLPHPPRRRATGIERLGAIVHLTFDDSLAEVAVEMLKGREKFLAISRAHVCYRIGGDAETLQNLEIRARLAAAVPVFGVRRPRSLRSLGQVTGILQRLDGAEG